MTLCYECPRIIATNAIRERESISQSLFKKSFKLSLYKLKATNSLTLKTTQDLI